MTTSDTTLRLLAARAAAVTLTLALPHAYAAEATAEAAADAGLPTPRVINGESPATAANILAARRYAAFWNTGKPEFAKAALAAGFTDRTLPAGRPQGPQGPIEASKNFRAAVPDLHAELEEVVAAGDRVVVRLHFTGTFTGKMGKVQGKGTKVDFQAMDLYRVADGKITDNWHLEDINLFKQLGMVQEAK
jgi:predicted ester cyclase